MSDKNPSEFKLVLGAIIILLVWFSIIFGCWVGAAWLAVKFLPQSLWIPAACLGMLFGMVIPPTVLGVFSNESES